MIEEQKRDLQVRVMLYRTYAKECRDRENVRDARTFELKATEYEQRLQRLEQS